MIWNLYTNPGHTLIRYPAGELEVRLNDDTIQLLKKTDQLVLVLPPAIAVDLNYTMALFDAITGVNHHIDVELLLPYMPHSRGDRRFVLGGSFGLQMYHTIVQRPVMCINTIDGHSNVETAITNHTVIPEILAVSAHYLTPEYGGHLNLLFPDKGAADRYRGVLAADPRGLLVSAFYGTKERSALTGKFVGFKIPDIDNPGPVLIIDDLCDGGGTFVGVGRLLVEQATRLGYHRRLNALYVTHGLFSRGTDMLGTHGAISDIWTTDTWPAAYGSGREPFSRSPNVRVIPVVQRVAEAIEKELNV